jgi:hypothetical protein
VTANQRPAISLAAVDEAVFAVLASGGMEEVFFLLEQELLEPIYAIYNWDPFADGARPPSDVIQLEQAIFSSTARVNQGDVVPSAFIARATTREADRSGDRADFAGGDMEPAMPMEVGPAMLPRQRATVAAADSCRLLPPPAFGNSAHHLVRVTASSRSSPGGRSRALVLVGIATFVVYRPKAFLITPA